MAGSAGAGGNGDASTANGLTMGPAAGCGSGEEACGMRFGLLPCGEATAAASCVGAAAGVTASAVGLHEEATGGGCESRRRTARCAGCCGDVNYVMPW